MVHPELEKNGARPRRTADPNVNALVGVPGLFSMSHMSYAGTGEAERDDEPSLGDMTLAAIEMLRENENGYVLFVEGGRIDHAHHQNLVSWFG